MATRGGRGDAGGKRKFGRRVGTAIHQRSKHVGSGRVADQRSCRSHINSNRHRPTITHLRPGRFGGNGSNFPTIMLIMQPAKSTHSTEND